MKLFEYLYFGICFLILMAVPAHAYVDPSMVTATLSVITGIAVAVGAVVGVAWRRAKNKVQEKLGIDANAKKEVEEDIEFEEDDD